METLDYVTMVLSSTLLRPLHRYVLKPSNPVFQNVTAGVKVLKELVKLRELNRVALTQYTWAPYKKRRLGHRHSVTENPWRQRAKMPATSQEEKPREKPPAPISGF